MKKEKITKTERTDIPVKIDYFYNFKGKPMVRIAGNFMSGGFNLSKNKVKAVLDNAAVLKDFADGKLDSGLSELAEDEVLKN